MENNVTVTVVKNGVQVAQETVPNLPRVEIQLEVTAPDYLVSYTGEDGVTRDSIRNVLTLWKSDCALTINLVKATTAHEDVSLKVGESLDLAALRAEKPVPADLVTGRTG